MVINEKEKKGPLDESVKGQLLTFLALSKSFFFSFLLLLSLLIFLSGSKANERAEQSVFFVLTVLYLTRKKVRSDRGHEIRRIFTRYSSITFLPRESYGF